MILYYTERSPFARKVRMVAQHHQLLDKITLVPMMPTDRQPELMKVNPLGKIPVLVLPQDGAIIDSPVICRYLDQLGKQPKLVPEEPGEAIRLMHLEALADGILDAAVAMMMESWRPKEYQYPGQFEKQTENILGTLTMLEQQLDLFEMPLSLVHLSVGTAIDYIHFRLPAANITREWLSDTPQLAVWYQQFAKQPLMVETSPKEGW